MSLFWSVFSLSLLLVVLQALCAWRDNMFSVSQMETFHADRGVPFVAHSGMWADVSLLTPLMAWMVAKYSGTWSPPAMGVAFGAGVALSFVMHLTYIAGGRIFPEAHTHDGYLTAAGWIHLCYMAAGFALIALFFLATPHPERADVYVMYFFLVIHVIFGVHVPLKIAEPHWFPYRGILDMGTLAPIVGSIVALSVLSYWALR